MTQKFKVTDIGLQVDKVQILPGSELTIKGDVPGHWQRFGSVVSDAPKSVTVATPGAAKRGRPRKDAQ